VPAKPLIAIVEDDASLRPALIGFVRSLGYEGEGFVSAEAFLAGDAAARAECLVSDYQLPGIDGIALATQLRGQLPVILVTARTEQGIETRARAAGICQVLRKPFDTDLLEACLRQALDS
jgi:FixJ family two-component response regulator